MGEQYVIKFWDGTPDILVEIPPGRYFGWTDGVLASFRSGGGDGALEWAYAPGTWKSVHRVNPGDVIHKGAKC